MNERFETSVPGVFAIGDCVPGPMLAHKAARGGRRVRRADGGPARPRRHSARAVGRLHLARDRGVGETEEALRERGADYRAGKFPFTANARAKITGDTQGS